MRGRARNFRRKISLMILNSFLTQVSSQTLTPMSRPNRMVTQLSLFFEKRSGHRYNRLELLGRLHFQKMSNKRF